MIVRKWLIGCLVTLTFCLIGWYIHAFNSDKGIDGGGVYVTADTNEIYQRLKNSLNIDYPGYGVSDYGDNDVAHIPKAYAMVLSSELLQYYKSFGKYDLTLANKAGRWLLDNYDLNKDGIAGWGVPIAWDAFGDGTVNPANSEYTITTGIVLNALLDWVELAPDTAPKQEIFQRIRAAIEPYLDDAIFSNSGLFNYSLTRQDRKYNVFNAAAYMAGQMQRFHRFLEDDYLKKRIEKVTDRVMLAHFYFKQIDANGGWFWSYSIEEANTPNDLAHAGYVIEGILSYMDNQGNLAGLFDRAAILKHLELFANTDYSEWFFLPHTYGSKPLGARLYGLGFTLHILSKYFAEDDRISPLIAFLEKYRQGEEYSRWQNEKIVITEYLTYVMYGLASVDAYPIINNTVFLKKAEQSGAVLEDDSYKNEVPIALASFLDGVKVSLSRSTLQTNIAFEGHKVLLDKIQAVPLKIIEDGGRYLVLMRELLTNHLYLVSLNKLNLQVTYQNIDQYTDSFLDFREGLFHQEQLLIVAYDSLRGRNILKIFVENEGEFKEKQTIELPSVKDPAGSTYEVIPKFFLLPSYNEKFRVHIMAGQLYMIYDGHSLIEKPLVDDIEVFVEVIKGHHDELYALVKTTMSLFAIYDFQKNQIVHSFEPGDIPFNLDFYRDRVQYQLLNTKNDIKELFIKDFLANKASGILYLGSNNIEGWSAWAQVYYLNGLLSFLELARDDTDFFEVFKDYVILVQRRVELEMLLLTHQLNSADGLRVRVFSVDRSLATFAVQSSRFALLYKRYLRLFPHDTLAKEALRVLDNEVVHLTNHMEVLEKGVGKTVSKQWNSDNAYYLAWPRGKAFYFDGVPVPYNHQNEWATYVIQTDKHEVADSVINLFVNHITDYRKREELPKKAIWPYWWAKAWEGWSEQEEISFNKPTYAGDKGDGWISFRTIDTIAMLKLFAARHEYQYVNQVMDFVREGDVYPFVAKELISFNRVPAFLDSTISRFIRFTSPWELDNVVWSYFGFIKKMNKTY